jgi:30S ribosomal protein S31
MVGISLKNNLETNFYKKNYNFVALNTTFHCIMGKGDKKTAKGKRTIGSYGNSRKRKSDKPVVSVKAKKETKKTEVSATEKPAAKKPATKKPAAKKTTKKEV